MSKSINKRVEQVKNEHLELLKMVKEKISENSDNFQNHTNEILNTLEYDEENVKKYEATVQAQELVVSLTKQILEAKDLEEIIAIRKKLNYYINKIKRELKNRGLSETVIVNFQEQSITLRKSIANYIRFIKREDNICEIDKLYSNYDNLSAEEINNLKKYLAKEKRYNKRNFDFLTGKEKVKTDSINKEASSTPILEMDTKTKESHQELAPDVKEDKNGSIEDSIAVSEISVDDFNSLQIDDDNGDLMFITGELPYEELSNYFKKRIDSFGQMYNIVDTYDYEYHHFGKNVLNFFRNIPRYVHNKKAIQLMVKEYLLFYRGDDLSSFIEYTKRRNSISKNLKCIFSKSYLFTNDATYLNEHENCAKWMYDFCQKKSLTLCVKKLAA